MKNNPLRFGIDLGGTKAEIIALDEQGQECYRRRAATPAGDYLGTLALIEALLGQAESELGATGSLGIGTPGAMSKVTGNMKNCNSTCLNGQPLPRDLEQRLQRPVWVANDADCFTLSEATDGAAAGAASVFGVILGTGVGGGIVAHGRLLSGPNAIAGEWGHNPLPWSSQETWPGPACYCGRHACIETYLSGPGLSRDHALACGETCAAADIAARAAAGDAACEASMQRYEERLARALALVINILDPEVIVLGGGLSNCARLYENVPRLWGDHVFSDRVDTRLAAPRFGDSSGVRGAAWLPGS